MRKEDAFTGWAGAVASGLLGVLCASSPAAFATEAYVADGSRANASATGAASISALVPVTAENGNPTLTEVLYDGTTLYSGVSFTQFRLDIPAAGNLTVRLDDLGFPSLAGALSFALVQGGDVAGVLPSAGLLEMDIAGAGQFFAFVYAVGAPGVGIGSYYLNVTHEYQSPIPLPASVWFLLSGVAFSGWLGRRRHVPASPG